MEPPYVVKETISNLLHSEPMGERYEGLKKHRLEFMSYLRPLLQEGKDDGEGWTFLYTHVQDNIAMFHKILEERTRSEGIEEDMEAFQK